MIWPYQAGNKKAAALFLEKICFKQHGGMGQEESCGYLLFRENHESSKNPPFIVTKTKPAETSRFDRQEQLYKVWEVRSSAVTS